MSALNKQWAGETARLVTCLKLKHEGLVQVPQLLCEKPDAAANACDLPLHLGDKVPSTAAHLCEDVPRPLSTQGRSHYK